ncbi:hypothetical protein [Mycobacteroides abscessus]|uniref:hypothetical protein n=1 Tax=Mycobacteroides abscessus TaxID=36809 RepID=UPI0013000081|nr:hypothetical protein [Mycobacteroides abscessus]
MFEETKAFRKTYELTDWEGGIAVYIAMGNYGVKIISIPRLGLSTAITSDSNYEISSMLMRNRTLYNNPKEMELLESMIQRDMNMIGWDVLDS